MVMLSKKALLAFHINDVEVDAPRDWQDIEVLATFDNEATQANITTDQFTFVLGEATKIRQHIANGLLGGVGIFEGLPFKITSYNNAATRVAFEGYLDLSDEFEDNIQINEVRAKIKKSNGLNSLEERLSSLTYGWLYNQGYFSDTFDFGAGLGTEVEYVVEQKIQFLEILTTSIVTYLMVKELAEQTKATVKAINDAVAHFSGGVTGPIAAAIWTVAEAIIQVAYTALLLVAVLELANKIVSTFISPVRKHRCFSFHKLLEVVANYLGYEFETGLPELQEWHFLPSNPNVDNVDGAGLLQSVKSIFPGIPQVSDYGYLCSEMFSLAKTLFNGKYAIVGNTLVFRNVDDPYWLRLSTWQMPNVLRPIKRYNTDEFSANRIVAFDTDINDEWTIDIFAGTNHEVITDAITVVHPDAKYLKGLDEIRIQACLGNKKTELNGLEKTLAALASIVDGLANIFGGDSDMAGRVRARVGTLKVSNNYHSKPKILKLTGNRLSNDYRAKVNAINIYDTYYIGRSFVKNNWYGQKEKYTGVRIPFGMTDFLQLIENSYFYDEDGTEAKMEAIRWKMGMDYATVDFWIRRPYTYNLKEITTNDPSGGGAA